MKPGTFRFGSCVLRIIVVIYYTDRRGLLREDDPNDDGLYREREAA